jgi:hypothetical protein
MSTISKVAEDIINRSPFLREAMTENLINISALARKIKPDIDSFFENDIKEGAIIMAIKRLAPGVDFRLNLKIESIVKEIGDYLVRSNLSSFTYENSESKMNYCTYLNLTKLNLFIPLVKGLQKPVL